MSKIISFLKGYGVPYLILLFIGVLSNQSNAATVVSYLLQAQPQNNTWHHITEVNPEQQINELGNLQTRLLILLNGADNDVEDENLEATLIGSLTSVFDPGNVGIIANAHTTVIRNWESGNAHGDSGNLHIFANHQASIAYAYSHINVNSPQGEFEVHNADLLYHTEPKALSSALAQVDNPLLMNHPITDIILISRNAICHCCARLILHILSHRRNQNFPNILVMSHAELNRWLVRANILGAHTQAIRNQVQQTMNQQLGNRNMLALLIKYQ